MYGMSIRRKQTRIGLLHRSQVLTDSVANVSLSQSFRLLLLRVFHWAVCGSAFPSRWNFGVGLVY